MDFSRVPSNDVENKMMQWRRYERYSLLRAKCLKVKIMACHSKGLQGERMGREKEREWVGEKDRGLSGRGS